MEIGEDESKPVAVRLRWLMDKKEKEMEEIRVEFMVLQEALLHIEELGGEVN